MNGIYKCIFNAGKSAVFFLSYGKMNIRSVKYLFIFYCLTSCCHIFCSVLNGEMTNYCLSGENSRQLETKKNIYL
jgi:hypothetical protein